MLHMNYVLYATVEYNQPKEMYTQGEVCMVLFILMVMTTP